MRQLAFLLIASLAGCFTLTSANAVVVEINIETEGEPVPQAEITFETLEGEPIDLALFEEETSSETEEADPPLEEEPATEEAQIEEPVEEPQETIAEAPESQTAPSPTIVTDEEGAAQITLADALIGETVIAVIKRGGKIVKRHEVVPSEEEPEQIIEAYDPIDALISVGVEQVDDKCKRGEDCAFEVEIRNEGNGIYEGPLFVQGLLQGNWIAALSKTEGVTCGPARRGRTLCHLDLALQPGERLIRETNVALPRKLSSKARNCLGIVSPAEEAQTRSQPLISALQLGLAMEGLKPGRADGIDGPKTRAAIASYLEQKGVSGELSNEALFEMLYGYPLDRLGRLGVASEESCSKLALVAPPPVITKPKTVKKPKITKKKKPPARTVKRSDGVSKDTIRRAVGIGVTIGIGIMNNKRKKRHHPQHKSEPRELF